jgi:hypothetical protein
MEKNNIKYYLDIMKISNPISHDFKGDTIITIYKNFTYKFSLASGYSWIEENDKVICQQKLNY